jgi:hypothetical protein
MGMELTTTFSAYRAYKKYEKFHMLPQQLPGVNLTQDQLFFLNYAQVGTS